MHVKKLTAGERLRKFGRDVLRDRQLYLFLLPAVLLIFFFNYMPIYGLQIAFRDFKPSRGIWESNWVGMKWFLRFFKSPNMWVYVRNTLSLSVLGVLIAAMQWALSKTKK